MRFLIYIGISMSNGIVSDVLLLDK